MSALHAVPVARVPARDRASGRSIRVLSVVALILGTLALTVSGAPSAGAATPTITAVAAGWNHSCALTSTGGVKCWGANEFGQLGDGTTTPRSSPVDVVGLASGVVAIAAGGQRTCALTSAGGVKCWGSNVFGGVGDGTTTDRHTPVDVSGLASGVVAIAAGAFHTCAVTSAGAAKCWGGNEFGELGNGTTVPSGVPVDVVGLSSGVTAITAGGRQTCALNTAGGVKCWGHNHAGQLGDGGGNNQRTPVDVAGLSRGGVEIDAGGRHTCARLSTGGLKCWGRNDFGQVGDGTATDRITPVDVFGLTSGVTNVATGRWHTCAVVSGGVKCWGNVDGDGDVGDAGTLRPTDVAGLSSGAVSLAAGEGHTCVVMSSGGVKCFGNNVDGKLGNGTTAVSRSAVDVIFGDAPALAATATSLGATPNPSTAGQAVTFTARVTSSAPGSPTGTVTFREGTTVLGTAAVSGGSASFATSALGAGSHSVTAEYSGDAAFAGSSSSAVTQMVNPATQTATSTSLTSSPNPATSGQPVTFTARVQPTSGSGTPTGTVSFRRGRLILGTGTLVGGAASFTTSDLPEGTYDIAASYSGSTSFAASASAPVTQTVAPPSSGTPALSINDVSVVEGFDGTVSATFTISLSAPSTNTVTVSAVTHDVTATALKDYAPKSATVSFSPGQTTRTVVVGVKGDVRDEPDETFTFDLSSPVNATIADGTGVGTIVDDD
ncbi:MAG TPA: Ig-like domain repeat protein [Acidimicrobiales bacterium]|nr:Ig-like domain repeat protein [Acidimicrobiales bacterium]